MPFPLAIFGLPDTLWVEAAISIAVVLISMLVAALAHFAIFPLAARLSDRTPSDLDDVLIRAVRWPLNVGIVVLGAVLTLRERST